MREHARFLFIDDKHRAKVGEPGFPAMAAAGRGRQVIVAHDTSFEVGDHDFTKFSLIPSVVLQVDIPENVSESWYHGQVTVTLKDAAFEPSSLMRHTTELSKLLEGDAKPIFFLYSDGGPTTVLTYISVQIYSTNHTVQWPGSRLSMCCRCHSWRNPVVRVMSTLNLGMQCVGLVRRQGSDKHEEEAKK